MSNLLYDYLADSIFLDEANIKDGFRHYSDLDMRNKLDHYREYCHNNKSRITTEAESKESQLSTFSSRSITPLTLLKQTALYLDRFVVADPLYNLTHVPSEHSQVASQYLGYSDHTLNRISVSKACDYLNRLTPFVTGGFVKVLPQFEDTSSAKTPINIPTDYNNNLLPESIRDFFWQHTIVKKLEALSSGGYQVIEDEELVPCRGIVIDFQGATLDNSRIFHLLEMEVLKFDDENRIATIRQYLPDTPPDQDHFLAWVTQSVNASARDYFDKVFTDFVKSASLNAHYLSTDPFTNKLIEQKLRMEQTSSIQTTTARQLLEIELPFLTDVSPTQLMRVRANEEDIFTNFRLHLEKGLSELAVEEDPVIRKEKSERVIHELKDVQGHQISMKLKQIRTNALISAGISIAGLVASAPTGGYSLASTAIAAAKGISDYSKEIQDLKNTPGYFLWRVKK